MPKAARRSSGVLLLGLLVCAGAYVIRSFAAHHRNAQSAPRIPDVAVDQNALKVLSSTECKWIKLERVVRMDGGWQRSVDFEVAVSIGGFDPAITPALLSNIPLARSTPSDKSFDKLNRVLHAQIECLDSAGAPLLRPIHLSMVPIGGNSVETWAPATFPVETRALRFTVYDVNRPAIRSKWTIAAPIANVADETQSAPDVVKVPVDGLTVEAAAAELTPSKPSKYRDNPVIADLFRSANTPVNRDDCDLVDALVRITGDAGTRTQRQNDIGWQFVPSNIEIWGLDDTGSQLASAIYLPAGGSRYSGPPAWALSCGKAYPAGGDHNRVHVEGDLLRNAYAFDTLTLKNADLEYDPVAHCYSALWGVPQSVRSSTGRCIMALEPRWNRPLGLFVPPGKIPAVVVYAVKVPNDTKGMSYSDSAIGTSSDLGAMYSPMGGDPSDWGRVRIPSSVSIRTKMAPGFYQNQLKPILHDNYLISGTVFLVPIDGPIKPHIHLSAVTLRFADVKTLDVHHVAFNVPIRRNFDPSWLPFRQTNDPTAVDTPPSTIVRPWPLRPTGRGMTAFGGGGFAGGGYGGGYGGYAVGGGAGVPISKKH